MSIRITLQDHQADLLISFIDYSDSMLIYENTLVQRAHKVAGAFTQRRLAEVRALLTAVIDEPTP